MNNTYCFLDMSTAFWFTFTGPPSSELLLLDAIRPHLSRHGALNNNHRTVSKYSTKCPLQNNFSFLIIAHSQLANNMTRKKPSTPTIIQLLKYVRKTGVPRSWR